MCQQPIAVLETITKLWPKKKESNHLGRSVVGKCIELAQRKHLASGEPKPVSVSKKTPAATGMASNPDTKIIRKLGTVKVRTLSR